MFNEYTEYAGIDYNGLLDAIPIAVEALDDLVDENADNHPLEIQKENSLNYRNIGLGVMGLSTMLFKLGITYGSDMAKEKVDDLFDFLFKNSVIASVNLAEEKGAFPKYKEIVFDSSIMKEHFSDNQLREFKSIGLRNCSILSIAPNGSISTMVGVTGGCEPEFAIKYTRKTDNLKESYEIYCNEAQHFINEVNDKLPDFFVCSSDINWKDRIDMQAVMQKHIDTAISSTVNLPNEISLEDIEKLYLYAWEKKLKGITIYRAGCSREAILSSKGSKKDSDNEEEKAPIKTQEYHLQRGDLIEVDDNVLGLKRRLTTGCGTLHCQAYFDECTGFPLETYFSKGSDGGCNSFMVGLSRLISYSLRIGGRIEDIKDQLSSCPACPSYTTRKAIKGDTSRGTSCPMAIGNALLDMHTTFKKNFLLDYEDDEENETWEDDIYYKFDTQKECIIINPCPECGNELVFEGGCNSCKYCGYTKCD